MRTFRKTIGDTWKVLQGYTMQYKQDDSGCTYITFTKQVENVILGIDIKASDTGLVEISEEYIFEIIDEDVYLEAESYKGVTNHETSPNY